MRAEPSIRSSIIEARTYLRPLDDQGTVFETPEQATERVIGHQRWLWERAKAGMSRADGEWVLVSLTDTEEAELAELRELFLDRKVTFSGRARWLGGMPITQVVESTGFNCAGMEVRSVHDIVDALWLLLQGCGVGFRPIVGSLNGFTTAMDVEVVRSERTREQKGRETNIETYDRTTGVWTISIGDSAHAWAKSVGKLLAGKYPAKKLIIDFSEVRGAGGRLRNYGWISSGDAQIARAYGAIAEIMNNRVGQLLTRIDILDIMNWLGMILSSRRSAQIAFLAHGEPEWKAFATAKNNYWLTGNEQRAMSNNSLLFTRKPTRYELKNVFRLMEDAGGSEPGFINMVEAQRRAPYCHTFNPCAEQLLPDRGFCCLVETNLVPFNGDEEGLHRAHYLISRANYRATCVDFRDGILQESWHQNNQFLHLCGVGVTGAVAWEHQNEAQAWEALKDAAISGANSMADELHMPRAKHVTTVKPSGCLPIWANIITPTGIKRIHEMLEEHPDGVVWADTCDSVVRADGSVTSVDKTFDNGVDELYKVKTTYNLPIHGTAEHKWRLVSGEWRATKDLQVGDELSVVAGLYKNETPYAFKTLNKYRLNPHGGKTRTINQPSEMTSELAWFIGYMFGDGAQSASKYRIRFVDANEENLIRARNVLVDVFGLDSCAEVKKLSDRKAFALEVGSAGLWRWMLANDLMKDVSVGVPRAIRHGAAEHVIAFVAGLTDSDGCYNKRARSVIFTQSDDAFTKDFQQIAWAVGLAFGRSPNTKGQNLQKHKCIYLCTLGAHSTPEAVEALWRLSNKLKHHPVRTWNRVYAVRVEGVQSVGAHMTADISVPDGNEYVAYGCAASHNTASKVFGTNEHGEVAEGIHKPLAKYIFNRIRFTVHDPLVEKLRVANYKIEPDPYDPTGVLIVLPVAYEHIAFDRDGDLEVNLETAVQQLDRYKLVMDNYCQTNASITVSYDPGEVPAIIDWLIENWDSYVGVSFIYRADPTKTAKDLGYPYLPQTPVSKETYREYVSTLLPVNLTDVAAADMLDTGECTGGACPIR